VAIPTKEGGFELILGLDFLELQHFVAEMAGEKVEKN
jgi:hypothetical protein